MGDETARRRESTYKKRLAAPHEGRDSSVTDLQRMFGPPTRERVGSVEILKPQLSSFGKQELERLSAASGIDRLGLVGWLAQTWRAANEPSAKHLGDVLRALGDSWEASTLLPEDLLRGVPVPRHLHRVSPLEINQAIAGLTNEQIKSGLADGRLGPIELRRSRHYPVWMRRNIAGPEEDASLLAVAYRFPSMAWALWCYPSGHFETRGPRNVSSEVQSAIADLLTEEPDLLISSDPVAMVAALAALGPELARVRLVLRNAGLPWRLRVAGRRIGRPSLFQLSLPTERFLLVPTAAAVVCSVVGQLRHRRQEADSPDNDLNTLGSAISDVRDLTEAADDDSETWDVRASASLLAAIHPAGGFRQLVERRALLAECAHRGIPAASSVAAVVEYLGLWGDREARSVISELLGAGRAADRPVTAFLEEMRALDVILRQWRERSTAPITPSVVGAV